MEAVSRERLDGNQVLSNFFLSTRSFANLDTTSVSFRSRTMFHCLVPLSDKLINSLSYGSNSHSPLFAKKGKKITFLTIHKQLLVAPFSLQPLSVMWGKTYSRRIKKPQENK